MEGVNQLNLVMNYIITFETLQDAVSTGESY